MSILKQHRVADGEWVQHWRFDGASGARAGGDGGVAAIVETTDVIPGNSSTPYSILIGGQETGTVNTPTDRDWFQVTLTAGEWYLFTVLGDGPQGLTNGSLDVFSAGGTQLSHASGDGDEMGLIFAPPTTGTYFLSVGSDNNAGVGDYSISVDISSPTDSINWSQTMSTNAIQVYFASSGESFNGESVLRSWTGAEISAAMTALGTYAAATGLTFSQTGSVGEAELVLSLTDLESGVLGYAEVGTPYVFFDPGEVGWTATGLQQGGFGFVTLLHEFGHALGLAHPHDRGGGSPIMPDAGLPVGHYGVYGFNQGVFTTMTYNDAWPTGPLPAPSVTGLGWQGTPMALDIALLQQFYGVNPNFNGTSTTYALSATNAMYRAIWDTGGVDTISFAGSAAATIDLRAATIEYETGGAGRVSYVNGVSGGFTIAAGVVIENATGGSGADTITGNSTANVLSGSGGADTLTGLGGGDTLDGGAGDDIIYAMAGDVIDGGDGLDYLWLDLSALSSSVNWNAAAIGSNAGIAVAGGTIRNIEAYSLTTGSGNDVFTTSSVSADTYWVAGAGVDQFVGDFSASLQSFFFHSIAGGFELLFGGGAFRLQMFDVEQVAITGGGGNDTIWGTTLADAFAGNGGDDSIDGAGGDDALSGNDGADTLYGGDGLDTLEGGAGDDWIIGGAGADVVSGGAGDDRLEVGAGDWADGGDGRDRALIFLAAAFFDATQAATNAGATVSDGGHVRNVEILNISSNNSTHVLLTAAQAGSTWEAGRQSVDRLELDLSSVASSINMQFGIADPIVQSGLRTDISWNSALQFQAAFVDAFTISGGSAADVLRGHDQSDRLTGNSGNDTLFGGNNIDTAGYAMASTSASWHRNPDGTWTVTAGADGTDTLTSVEFLDFTDRDVFLDRPGSNFTTDGQSDLFLRNSTTGGSVFWFNGSPATAAFLGNISTSYVNEGFGDFNGDGRDDILWRNSATGDIASWFMNGSTVTGSAGFGLSVAWDISGIGDINGDQRDDLVLRSNTGDIVLWFMNSGGGGITGASMGNVSTAWQIEVLGDFNGDGRDDFIWRNGTTGDMSMWLMNGTSVTPNNFANVGGNWNIAGVGDLNGDGRDDVVWRDQTTGNTALWFMNGGTIVSQSGLNVATNFSIADVADYNGDGRDDIVWRSTTSDVFAWYMNGGVVQGSAFIGNLGSDWLINPGG